MEELSSVINCVNHVFTVCSGMAQKFVEDKIASGKVVVFSKSYCPFCTMAKKSLRDAGLNDFTVIELDDRGETMETMAK